jgi:hypothetical protein
MANIETKTGVYRYNPETDKVERVSTRPGFIPHVSFDDATCPVSGYVSEHLGHKPVFVKNRRHKRDLMRSAGLRECAGDK